MPRPLVALIACAIPLIAADGAEFFETKIRPLLATHCHACHTGGALGNLRLDSREGILKGGKSGRVVIEGKPENSLLIEAVKRTHVRLKMPPVGALSRDEVAALEEWIRIGLPWPEKVENVQATKSVITSEQKAFWSFQPLKPATAEPIDKFVNAKLAAAKITPARRADSRTWLRRVTYSLTGLPPTPEDADSFAAHPDKARAIDRLLASPQYGERWARHWLDLARYSDGELAASTDTPLPNAWRYRDWVIDALNNDLPYNTFVKAQITEVPGHIPGLGFQALGAGANDQVDVTTKVFLGLTVGCAQCHDHKYDPIPTRDYYSLLGIFRSSQTYQYALVDEKQVESYKVQKKKVDDLKEILNDYLAEQTKQLIDVFARDTAKYLLATWKNRPEGLDEETFKRWKTYLADPNKEHPYLKPWFDLLKSSPTEAEVKAEAEKYQQFVLELLDEAKEVDDKNYVAFGGRKGQKNETTRQYTNIVSLPVLKFYQWRELAYKAYVTDGFRAPAGVYFYDAKQIDRFLGGIAKGYVDKLRAEIKAAEAELPPMYPFLHAVKDAAKPADIKVALRGDPKTPGEVAPRRFLQALCAGEPDSFTQGSGRAQLADAIIAHPLAARVIVNRVWQHHFGKGIVRTPSNFGRMGERPTHPELLDQLAARFVANGWSLKKLHREILLSNTYARATAPNVDADPDNKLLGHFPLQHRLDMEALRDSVLQVTGQIDTKVGGPSSNFADDNTRRSLYLTVSRTRLDPSMALFDFPDANATTDERAVTAGPLQGLYWLNSEFIAKQARLLDERLAKEVGDTPSARIQRAYKLLYSRQPDAAEMRLGVEYLSAAGANAWPKYLQALLGSSEFSSVN
ncbi:MAG: PSD1 domain-containing protein [Acidobacteria bacterium]|nr:PSD1 domain-containing protein [Acidobacteriota bacterium]